MRVIILARQGSKRCPEKNIKEFEGGRTLIDECIRKARYLKPMEIILSTDIDWYADRYKGSHDVKVFERPMELRGDSVTSEAVVMNWMRTHGLGFTDDICMMQATTPCMKVDTLLMAKDMFMATGADSVISVNPQFKPNGAFYFVGGNEFMANGTWWCPKTALYRMSWEESVDIDWPWDFRIAQAVNRKDIYGEVEQ